MVSQMLINTPLWVYALFIALLVFGVMQSKTRTVKKLPALLLPLGMIAFSLAGINSSFGLKLMPLLAWGASLAITVLIGYRFFKNQGISYQAADNKFFIPGSWTPLMVMMAIFFAKYAYAVMKAKNLEIIALPIFIAVFSALYGLLSGYFAARAVNLLAQVKLTS